jgi:2-amino-4-hydroxy-6-hydroxymethyldihydropteridine diphosphokinase
MNRAVISLGSNVGDRLANLNRAKNELQEKDCHLLLASSVYETAAWGNTSQNSFYNEVIEIETKLSAQALMQIIFEIENKMGRVRKEKWEPRIIDMDILFFNDDVINETHLTVPHPFVHERKFVLVPMDEILPRFIHPIFKKTIHDLLSSVEDKLEVKRIFPLTAQ